MSKIKLTGDSSGYVEISAPSAAGNNTLELPATGSKIVVSDGSDNINVAGIVTASSLYTTSINDLNYPTAGPLSSRNLIINGAMQVAQRGTQSTSVTTSGYYTVDRIQWINLNLGTWTLDQSTDAPDAFSNSFKATCTTADASPAAGDYAVIFYKIEAQNLQHLEYGSSSAKPLTLSFYVKSNKTGNASFEIFQEDNSSKLYSVQYTINSADTWEKKTITIPGDTSGFINNDNGVGLRFGWWLNSGSNYTGGSFGGWKTYDATSRNVSNLGVGGATSDYFAITGVQLEVGEVATPFEHRSYGDELALCQRYFCKSYSPETSPGAGTDNGLQCLRNYDSSTQRSDHPAYVQFPVTMRTIPTVTLYSQNGNVNRYTLGDLTLASYQNQNGTIAAIRLEGTGSIGGLSVSSPSVSASAFAYFHYTASAEL